MLAAARMLRTREPVYVPVAKPSPMDAANVPLPSGLTCGASAGSLPSRVSLKPHKPYVLHVLLGDCSGLEIRS